MSFFSISLAYCCFCCKPSETRIRPEIPREIPELAFEKDRINMGYICFLSKHSVETTIHNKGYIQASFFLNSPRTNFGKTFTFNFGNGILSGHEHRQVKISFTGCYHTYQFFQ